MVTETQKTVSEQFDPDDMSELEGIFAQMIEDNETGFVMEFIISKLAAKELLGHWEKACQGNSVALALCLHEFGKIMAELTAALSE